MTSPSFSTPACGLACASACPAARRARRLPPALRRPKAGLLSLAALLAPSALFPAGLAWLGHAQPAFHWLRSPARWPWELWMIAACGTAALAGGLGDWAFHRWAARCVIGRAERRCELLALAGGGGPMFALMSAASFSARPQVWLLPALVVLLYTTALICYDEFIYHRRRCRRLETILHRALVFGNGLAWLAWAHWCFVRGGIGAYA